MYMYRRYTTKEVLFVLRRGKKHYKLVEVYCIIVGRLFSDKPRWSWTKRSRCSTQGKVAALTSPEHLRS
jgi:hypothetical protein